MLNYRHRKSSSPRRQWRLLRTTTTIPILLLFTIILSLLVIMHESSNSEPTLSSTPNLSTHLRYAARSDYFQQSLPSTDPSTFDFKKHSFGLITQSYDSDTSLPSNGKDLTQWQRFAHHLGQINAAAPARTSYRLLFLGRHGQGYHNVAEDYYGTEPWNCYWSTLDGNGTVSWADARLTKLGVQQAEEVNEFWRKMLDEEQMKVPESWYLSPLDRAIETADLTFRPLLKEHNKEYKPKVVKELLRENNGIHTCDRRSTKTEIQERWPEYHIEKGFTEKDELWRADVRETRVSHETRMRKLLEDVFAQDESTWISMTAHGGTIKMILEAVGHREFVLQTGGVIPLLVKVEEVEEKRPEDKTEPWQPKPECKGNPLLARKNGYHTFEEYVKDIGSVS